MAVYMACGPIWTSPKEGNSISSRKTLFDWWCSALVAQCLSWESCHLNLSQIVREDPHLYSTGQLPNLTHCSHVSWCIRSQHDQHDSKLFQRTMKKRTLQRYSLYSCLSLNFRSATSFSTPTNAFLALLSSRHLSLLHTASFPSFPALTHATMQLDLEIQNWCGGTSLEAIWQKTAKNVGIFAVADSVVLEYDSSFQSQSLPTNRELTMKFAEICNHKFASLVNQPLMQTA